MNTSPIETPQIPITEDYEQWLHWAVNEGAFAYYDEAFHLWHATMDLYPKQEWRWRWIEGVAHRLKRMQERYEPSPKQPTIQEALDELSK